MPWQVNGLPQRRSEPERQAYVQGFKAGVGIVRKYLAQGRPLGDLDLLMETLDEAAHMPDDPQDANEPGTSCVIRREDVIVAAMTEIGNRVANTGDNYEDWLRTFTEAVVGRLADDYMRAVEALRLISEDRVPCDDVMVDTAVPEAVREYARDALMRIRDAES